MFFEVPFINNPFEATIKYDAIVVAVAHKQFIQLTGSDYQRISADQAIVIDVKGAVQNPTWRL